MQPSIGRVRIAAPSGHEADTTVLLFPRRA